MIRQNVYDSIITDNGYAWFNTTYENMQFVHCHNEYEIFYFIQGDAEFRIEGRSYIPKPESLLLIPPNNMHKIVIKSANICRRSTIHFFPEILEPEEQNLLLKLFQLPDLYFPDLLDIQINAMIDKIKNCRNMETSLQSIAFKHLLISLLTDIYQLYIKTNIQTAPQNEKINSVLQYLNENIKENITLEQISRKFYINQGYLNRLFSREIGTTICRYVQIKRLILARQEIRKGCGIEEAAYKAGFNDYSNFFRAYKSFFGIKPSAQRNEDIKSVINIL